MEKTIFRMMLFVLVICACVVSYSFANAADVTLTEIGKVKCIDRMIEGDDHIQLLRFTDPDNPFVAIFFTRVDSGKWMKMANPSNTAIAARLIAPVPMKDGKQVVNTSYKDNLVILPQSVMSKEMKICRMYDKKMNTLTYIVYSTKWMDGSLKHSLSVVPLGMPLTQ